MGCTWAKVVEELALFFKDGLTNGAHKLVRHDTSPFTIPTRSPNLPRCDEGKWRWRDPSNRYRGSPPDSRQHPVEQNKKPWGINPRVFCFVEVAGIEPASFVGDQGLLRAQPAVIFSAPTVTQASCRRAQLLFSVPRYPVTG